jgi:transposase
MSLLASLPTSYEARLKMRQEVIIGVERRRRWRDEEKLAILDEVGVNGASVSDVARAHDITRQHIYQWRQELKRKGLLEATAGSGITFLPLVAPEPDGVDERLAGDIEIRVANGRTLRCPSDLCSDNLLRLVRLLEAI